MARKRKRPYGTGCVYREGRGWAIRWRETVRDENGEAKIVRRYELLKDVTKTEAEGILHRRMLHAVEPANDESDSHAMASVDGVTFGEHAQQWAEHILPKYRFSTRTVHQSILDKHLVPRFGMIKVMEISTFEIQKYVSEMQARGCAPYTIDQHHQILSDVMRSAVKWYGLASNPARGVEMPRIKPVRARWALTVDQARALLERLSFKPRAMVGLAVTTGVRRGELFALCWKDLNTEDGYIEVRQAVYKGHFDDPKTEGSSRVVPVAGSVIDLLGEWRKKCRRTGSEDLIFGTRNGRPEHPSNILRRHVFPACEALDLPRATWLTFRRTFSTWSHHNGVPPKAVAELMGHSNVRMQFRYIQGVDAEKRRAAELLAGQLVRIGQNCPSV